jgi:hypothetical protein
MHVSWQDAAEDALGVIFAQKRRRPRATVEQLRADLDGFIEDLFHAPAGFTVAESHWAVIGADAVELAEHWALVPTVSPKLVHRTLVRKQRDYGHTNISRFGRQGLLVRSHDKVARLENLTASGADPENEPIGDTVVDIIGYSAIGVMWERHQFLLPLR